jgi:hypothetical protein
MALAEMASKQLTKHLPKVLDAETHAIADYGMVAVFFGLAGWFWARNKRASIGAMMCGGAMLTTSLLTDYPGGVTDKISFQTHGRIDAGLAPLTAALPNFLKFGDEPEAKFFQLASIAEAAVTGMTDFGEGGEGEFRMPERQTA